jgi:hypothetical protein
VLPQEQERPKIARFRARWKAHQHRIDPKRLIFVDETWIKTNMTRVRGWSKRGTPLKAKVPYGHWKTLTFMAGLRLDRIDAPWVLDGPINRESFDAWVETQLIPILKRGDIVVLDNLSSHKSAKARKAVTADIFGCANKCLLKARICCSCRPTVPISTRSNRCSQSSKS